jgi:hypothetical protein
MRRCLTASNAKFFGRSALMVNELQMWRDGETTAGFSGVAYSRQEISGRLHRKPPTP